MKGRVERAIWKNVKVRDDALDWSNTNATTEVEGEVDMSLDKPEKG